MEKLVTVYDYKNRNDDSKIFDDLNKYSYKCKRCNRTVIIAKRDRSMCPDCGHWVYKSDALEFKYKLQEEMKKRRNDK